MTTPARQPHPDDLFLITREELDRCCSQMSAAGYKVSANYIEALVLSRPHTSPQAPRPPCEECIYQAQAASAAKAAREQVLDAIQDHNDGRLGGMDILFATPANERTESAQGAYLKEAYFELTLVKHLIESLRAQQEQLARPIGTCPEGEPYYGQTILCNLKGDCKFKKEQRPFTPYGAPWYLCGREDAALALAEREQQKEAEAGK